VIFSAKIGVVLNPTTCGGTHTTSGGNDIWVFNSSGTWSPTFLYLAAAQASYTLSLKTLGFAISMPLAQATYTLTRTSNILFKITGAINQAIHSASLSNNTKHTATIANAASHSTTLMNDTKH
jgi:hypothetical protein